MKTFIVRITSLMIAMMLSVVFLTTVPSAFAADMTTDMTIDMAVAEASTGDATITSVKTSSVLNGTRFLALAGGVLGFAIVGGFVISGVRHFEDTHDGN